MASIKESMEVFEAAKSLSVDTIRALKDGLDISDLSVLTNNVEKVRIAVEGIEEIPAELKDLDQAEIIQIVGAAVAFYFEVVSALKEEKSV